MNEENPSTDATFDRLLDELHGIQSGQSYAAALEWTSRQTLYNRHKELLGELKEQCRRKPRHPIDSTAYRIRDGRTIPAKEKE